MRGRRPLAGRGAGVGVAALAVLVDAVAGDVLGARVDVGARVVAVAAAEAGREPVAVVVGQPARGAEQQAQAPGVVRHCLEGGRPLGEPRPDQEAAHRRDGDGNRQPQPQRRRKTRAQGATRARAEPEEAVRRAEDDRRRQRVERPEVEHPPVGARERDDERQHGGRRQRGEQGAGGAQRARAGQEARQAAQPGEGADRRHRAGERADHHQPGRGDGGQLLAGHLADQDPLPGRRHHRDDQRRQQRGQDPGRHRAVALGLGPQRAPGGRPSFLEGVGHQLRAVAADDRRRAVEPQRQRHDAGAAARREDEVEEPRAAHPSQDRSSDRAPQVGKFHLRPSQLTRARVGYNLSRNCFGRAELA